MKGRDVVCPRVGDEFVTPGGGSGIVQRVYWSESNVFVSSFLTPSKVVDVLSLGVYLRRYGGLILRPPRASRGAK